MLTLNLCYDQQDQRSAKLSLVETGGRGVSKFCLTLFIPEGGVLVRGHIILLILLVTGGMMEGVNPTGHICINMPLQKGKMFLEKKTCF